MGFDEWARWGVLLVGTLRSHFATEPPKQMYSRLQSSPVKSGMTHKTRVATRIDQAINVALPISHI